MEQSQNKAFQVHQTLMVDKYTLSRKTSDLTQFCKLLNEFFAELVKQGFMGLNSITFDMVEAAALFDAQPIIEAVAALYDKETSQMKYMGAKHVLQKAKELAANDIKADVAIMQDKYEKEALKYYKPNAEGKKWRLSFLTLTDGYVGFDNEAVLQACTKNIETEEQAELLNMAKRLYLQIVDFNRLCKKHNGIGVGSLIDGAMDEPIISVDPSNELFFDPKAALLMDF